MLPLELPLGRRAAARSARSTCRRTISARSSAPSSSSCRGCPAARAEASSRRRTTAGSPSTTTPATATRRCCAAWRRELSERTGAVVLAIGIEHEQVVRFVLLEAGRIVDEYLSVPEHYGPLPPGDAIALAANPRVVARLTGADPAAVRAAARTAPCRRPAARAGAAAADRGRDRARGRRPRLGGRPQSPLRR